MQTHFIPDRGTHAPWIRMLAAVFLATMGLGSRPVLGVEGDRGSVSPNEGGGTLFAAPPQGSSSERPNIVIIMSDDQRWDTVTPRYMPRLTSRMVDGINAVYLRDSFVPNALCCPSRVTTLTGKYSDESGVYGNGGIFSGGVGTGGGGFESFDDSPKVNPTIATDLQGLGYRTALIGKYLNHYPDAANWNYVPPGWDRWFAVATGSYYNYRASSDGHLLTFGSDPADHATRVLSDQALGFIHGSAASGDPFFLYLALTAPHSPNIPDPRDVGRFDADVDSYPEPASVGEPDVSDKSAYIRDRSWSRQQQESSDDFHARQLNSIYGVDRAVQKIWDTVPDNTVVLYMSDNGYEWGEHRWPSKEVPYNESIRVPMIIATKGLGKPNVDPDRIALNVDIRATLESFAGFSPVTMGRSWMDASWTRPEFVLEHWSNDYLHVPTYCGVRSKGWMYVRYATGEEELYDEHADPLELTNIASTDPQQLGVMRTRAAGLCQQGTIYPPDWPFPAHH